MSFGFDSFFVGNGSGFSDEYARIEIRGLEHDQEYRIEIHGSRNNVANQRLDAEIEKRGPKSPKVAKRQKDRLGASYDKADFFQGVKEAEAAVSGHGRRRRRG